MPKLPSRLTLIGSGFGLAALAVVGRAAQLQLVQGDRWRAEAARQQTTRVVVPARRGTIFDRNGNELARSQVTYAIGVAPRDLDDDGEAATLLARATGRPRAEVAARLAADRVWIEWPGPFTLTAVSPLRNLTGVHLLRRLDRFYARPDLAARLIGSVDQDGRGASGLERSFDTLLAGRPGSAVMLKDERGRLYPSPSRPHADPVDGLDVTLTLDAELQEIADRALAQAVADAHASGGDVIILQPHTGEVLAISSVRRSGGALGVIAEPYEPGSTAKPFTAAALLQLGRAQPHDTVFAENGQWTVAPGYVIHDEHKSGKLTLVDVIRLSSNIGIAKFSQLLSPAEEFQSLRDFGFGTPTGIEVPGESPGVLKRPAQWSQPTQHSMAMGYELNVTPLQLAAAYAVFANGGALLEPTLLRAVRTAEGTERWSHEPRRVRQVVSKAVADQMSGILREVVEEGTGKRAALGTYQLAGKTGTVRRNIRGRYEQGRYTASFVGIFPKDDPQLVLLVKIDDPEGDYFGGSRAAPVTRTILEAALATQDVALDRGRLTHETAPAAPARSTREAPAAPAAVTIGWPLAPADTAAAPPRPVPDVAGRSVREAARSLHGSGFRVRVEGWGAVTGTSPAAGASAAPGAVVVVRGAGHGER